MNIRLHGLVGTLVACASIAAFGHHSVQASFDIENPMEINGVVEGAVWVNPHAYVLMTVAGADGEAEVWAVELSAPNALIRKGFDRDTLATGDEIAIMALRQLPGVIAASRISGHENRELQDSLNEVYDLAAANRLFHAESMTLADGTRFESLGGMWRQGFDARE